ncbi:hypothetical protein H1230_16435 [Paenibacillus sp. 19GGS1-52]|uniref:hypothetical protein n=1 Tax=Paenibacillus sp. 19GGS1-52 TaxID=2758563 RepID=UPI001EFB2DA7|nr:hypothetical protein [Paenibacillus sp. 19GGS1-52]ULO04751.1 hypothetical protein H1230_16435 [Paenibacillus sp. 19GGS1-52]
MRKLDYLLGTSPGNYHRYRDRYMKRLSFSINQETYSKKSMRGKEKQRFLDELNSYMCSNHRGAYRGPVVLQMDFYPKRGNPPSIHQLAKNYIDLLYPRESKKLRLPLLDDRQVAILIVNYHIQLENEKPLIQIKMAPIRDFLEDLQLYNMIRSGSGFTEDDGDYRYDVERTWSNGTIHMS